jgi:hypothetical protein
MRELAPTKSDCCGRQLSLCAFRHPPRSMRDPPFDFWTPPALSGTGHQCGPSQRMITPPRTGSSSARARSDADKGAFDLPRVGASKNRRVLSCDDAEQSCCSGSRLEFEDA